jgi:hypothetical protein
VVLVVELVEVKLVVFHGLMPGGNDFMRVFTWTWSENNPVVFHDLKVDVTPSGSSTI